MIKFTITLIILMLVMPTASATVTDFTVIEPFPESVIAGNSVSATVSFISDQEPFNITMTFTSPTLLSENVTELVDTMLDFEYRLSPWCIYNNTIGECEGAALGTCEYIYSEYTYITHCTLNNYNGTHTVTAGFILNPAIQPDNYTFDLTVSWLEEDKIVRKRTSKSSRGHIIPPEPTEEQEPFMLTSYRWYPYEDEEGNGHIHLNGTEPEFERKYIEGGVPEDDGHRPPPDGVMYLIVIMLLVVLLTACASRQAYEYKNKKVE